MPPLSDPVILGVFRRLLADWRYDGYVTANEVALDWIANELAGLTLRQVAQALHEFLNAGGVIDQQPEHRPEWNTWPFHYDFRVKIGYRVVYIETILQDDHPGDETIHIVSIHDV